MDIIRVVNQLLSLGGFILFATIFLVAEEKKTSANVEQSTPVKPGAAYSIGAGDVLQINIWKEAEASVPQVVVSLDGIVSLPLVRDVQTGGLTTAELEEVLIKKYAKFFREVEISVVVKEIHSKKIYLIGAVRKEGAIALKSPTNVLQAIAEAGGLTDYAKRSKIFVLRNEGGKQVRLPFDYQAAIKGRRMEQIVMLCPGDTVMVP